MSALAKKVAELFSKPEMVPKLSTPSAARKENTARSCPEKTCPCINDRGELVIPYDSDPKYHWWAAGQSLRETLRELGAPPEVVGRYIDTDLTIKQ